MQPYFNPRVIE